MIFLQGVFIVVAAESHVSGPTKHMLSRLAGALRADTPQSRRPVSVLTSVPNEALDQLISELSELFADDFIDSAAAFMS